MELVQNLNEINISKIIPDLANHALDLGLKTILPDFIENDVIKIKDAFLENGFTAGLEEAKEKAEEVYKSIKGVFTGEFDSLGEIKKLLQKGGILNTASKMTDKILKIVLDTGIINKTTYNMIKTGKNAILNTLESDLNTYLKIDEYDLEKMQTQIEEWKQSYKNQDYEGMEKTAKKLSQTLQKNEKLENLLEQARNIEKSQKYIEKKGSIENLTKAEKKILESIK